jgi:PRC-barrel domain protein
MAQKEGLMATIEIWTFHVPGAIGTDLTGFTVETIDGKIGKVDEATHETDGSCIVVDTGHWIFGKKVPLPAGVIDDVDLDTEMLYVNRTKDEIKNAPEFDEQQYLDEGYRNQLGGYYGPGGRGYRESDKR